MTDEPTKSAGEPWQGLADKLGAPVMPCDGTGRTFKPAIACPECGDASHIYAKLDAKWNPESGQWELQPFFDTDEGSLDCTECDHRFPDGLPEGMPEPSGENLALTGRGKSATDADKLARVREILNGDGFDCLGDMVDAALGEIDSTEGGN